MQKFEIQRKVLFSTCSSQTSHLSMSGRAPNRKRRKSDAAKTPDTGGKVKRQTTLLRSFQRINKAVAHAERSASQPLQQDGSAAPAQGSEVPLTIDLTNAAGAGTRTTSAGQARPSTSQNSRGSAQRGPSQSQVRTRSTRKCTPPSCFCCMHVYRCLKTLSQQPNRPNNICFRATWSLAASRRNQLHLSAT